MKGFALLTVALSFSAFAEKWDDNNNPKNFNRNYRYELSALPMKSILPIDKMVWSSSWWPRNKGSINYRWNSPNPTGYIVNPTKNQVMRMSREEIAQLSPAEKFDLAHGNYDFPLSRDITFNTDPKAKDYEGICDGWTASAIQFEEPAPVDYTNADGLVIPFGTSDVKALMSYDISINMHSGELNPAFIGGYCSIPFGMRMGTSKCKDINPGAFHVVLANQIGLRQEAFAADVDPGKETWNQPVYGFEFEIRGRTKANGAAQAYIVHAKMMYGEDDPKEEERKQKVFSWEPTIGTENFVGTTAEFDYILELDAYGRIIGGEWLEDSKSNHPDLFWIPQNQIKFTPEFELINKIYKPASAVAR